MHNLLLSPNLFLLGLDFGEVFGLNLRELSLGNLDFTLLFFVQNFVSHFDLKLVVIVSNTDSDFLVVYGSHIQVSSYLTDACPEALDIVGIVKT